MTPNETDQKRKSAAMRGVTRTLYVLYRILRALLIPALCVGALFVGLTIGYATIGGGEAADVFKISTWKHLYDLVFEGT